MISCKNFYDCLIRNEINFFTGVPDSLLKDFCAYVNDNTSKKKNIIAANEGNAIALASGYHLATGKIGLVYMQNSGEGNAINPLTSLTDSDVYSIPILLIIGWRGEPGKKDEPQHVKMGKVTLDILDVLKIPYKILDDNYEDVINNALEYMKSEKAPYAIVIKKGIFEDYKSKNNNKKNYELDREEAIKTIVTLLNGNDAVISTTGKTSRELFEFREEVKQRHEKDFLTVGSMGHSSSIALGISLEKPDRTVYCFDGDGALIMHMGALAIVGQLRPKNFKHIVFNNYSHDSVGGQPTAAFNIDMPQIARSNGYVDAFSVETKDQVVEYIKKIKNMEGPVLLEIKVNKGARDDLGRPTTSPIDNKEEFMKFLQS